MVHFFLWWKLLNFVSELYLSQGDADGGEGHEADTLLYPKSQSSGEPEMPLLWECFAVTELLPTEDYLVMKQKTSGWETALSFTLIEIAYN